MKYFLILALTSLAILPSTVVSGGEKEDKNDRRLKKGEKKSFETDYDSTSFTIKGKTKSSGESGSIQYKFSFDDGIPKFRVTASKKIDGIKDSRQRTAFEVGIEGLLEVNGNPSASSLSINNATKALFFRKLDDKTKQKWSKLMFSQVSTDNGTIYTATTMILFKDDPKYGNLNVTLKVQVADSFINLGSQGIIDPMGQKYSIYIKDWSYAQPSTHLTLIKSVKAVERSVKFNNGTVSGASSTVNGQILVNDNFGLVDWKSTIEVDGVESPVVVSELFKSSDVDDDDRDEDKLLPKVLGFNFPRGTSLIWDPYVGFAAESFVVTGDTAPTLIKSLWLLTSFLVFYL